MTQSKIKTWEVVDMGINYPDYWEGFGTYGTPFLESIADCGSDANDAAHYILESIAMLDIAFPDELYDELMALDGVIPTDFWKDGLDGLSAMYYVGVRYTLEDDSE